MQRKFVFCLYSSTPWREQVFGCTESLYFIANKVYTKTHTCGYADVALRKLLVHFHFLVMKSYIVAK